MSGYLTSVNESNFLDCVFERMLRTEFDPYGLDKREYVIRSFQGTGFSRERVEHAVDFLCYLSRTRDLDYLEVNS